MSRSEKLGGEAGDLENANGYVVLHDIKTK